MTRGRPLVAVLDYGIGNLRSAQKALERVGADARLTADESIVRDAAGVVLPGVGAFGRCMDALERTGLASIAKETATGDVPFLGICIGMQLLYDESEENPGRAGLGVLPGTVRRLPEGVKHPQMQWNTLAVRNGSSAVRRTARPGVVLLRPFVRAGRPRQCLCDLRLRRHGRGRGRARQRRSDAVPP